MKELLGVYLEAGMDILDLDVWERNKLRDAKKRSKKQPMILREVMKVVDDGDLELVCEIMILLAPAVNGMFVRQLELAGNVKGKHFPKSIAAVAPKEATLLNKRIDTILEDEKFDVLFKATPAYVGILNHLSKLVDEKDPKEMKKKLVILQELAMILYRAGRPTFLVTASDWLVNPDKNDDDALKWVELAIDVVMPINKDPLVEFWKKMNKNGRRKYHPGEKGGWINALIGEWIMGAGWSVFSAATGQSLEGNKGFVLLLNLLKTKKGIEEECSKNGWKIPRKLEKYLWLLYLNHEHDHRFKYKAGNIFAELATDLPAILEMLDLVGKYSGLNLRDAIKVIWGEYIQAAKVPDKDLINEDAYGYSARVVTQSMLKIGVIAKDKKGKLVVDLDKIGQWKKELVRMHWEVKKKKLPKLDVGAVEFD